ncbi:Engulfment/cell motility, partial [Sporodiniella umbellata]
LWHLMMPQEALTSRVSSQWIQIGFQGTDPATDFRGMGIQGLDDLLYFAKYHPNVVRSVFQHSTHPKYWYPYAIVGINISKFLYLLLDSRKLQAHLLQHGTAYQEIYCYLFYRFDSSWQSTVMEFETKFKEFQFIIERELEEKKPMRILDNLQIYKRKDGETKEL